MLLLSLVALHLQHRFGYGAIATALVAVALLARRSDFDAPGDPDVHPRLAARALLFGGVIFGYALIALWVNRVMADQPFTLGFALRETGRAAAGINTGGSEHLSGAFGEWFPLSRPDAHGLRRRSPARSVACSLALPACAHRRITAV